MWPFFGAKVENEHLQKNNKNNSFSLSLSLLFSSLCIWFSCWWFQKTKDRTEIHSVFHLNNSSFFFRGKFCAFGGQLNSFVFLSEILRKIVCLCVFYFILLFLFLKLFRDACFFLNILCSTFLKAYNVNHG